MHAARPDQDPLGRGFHIIQATIAVGSGGLLGKGWLEGTQTHLEFIPERSTDFIFAVYSEEFGLAGNMVLIALYLALIARGLVIAAGAPTFFTRLLGGRDHAQFFYVRVRQHGNGERHPARGRRAAPAHLLRRDGAGYAVYRARDPDEHSRLSQARANMSGALRSAGAGFAALVIAGCASTPLPNRRRPRRQASRPPAAPRPRPYPRRSGVALITSMTVRAKVHRPTLDRIPDAEPRLEPLHRFANNPYIVFGKEYVPERKLRPFRQRGTASWYGRRFHGQTTSTGEPYDMYAMTGAHPTLPLPSYARVTNLVNGRTVVIRLNDRGPFHAGRIIDLSYTAAAKLGYVGQGSTAVEVEAIVPGVAVAVRHGQRRKNVLRPRAQRPGAAKRLPPASLYLQLAAFSYAQVLSALRAQLSLELAALDRAIEIFLHDGLYRLHVGPYRTRAEAVAAADRLKGMVDLAPRIVVR